mmetsp:Transcript_43412/g.81069  ORF Transcript_43412/g.81069 Transcript_43412/m.81069 type:complete len:307 (-) Transcript_43412:100-1020(-)
MGGTNVYIDDLPLDADDAMLNQICGLYGVVTWAKVMPSKGKPSSIGIVEFSTAEEAQWFVENLNGNIPEGLTTPIKATLKKDKGGKSGGKGYGKSSDGGGKSSGKGFSPYGGKSEWKSDGGKQAEKPAWQPPWANKGGKGWKEKEQPAPEPEGQTIEGFVAQWGLDDKAQMALLGLDPQTQQRVMSAFSPTDMSRANQMFMGFVKSVAGKGRSAPTAQQAFGAASDKTRNVYVNDLPAEVDDHMCKEIFGQYGTVTWLKLMPGKGKPTVSAIVEFSTLEESQWVVENLNGNVPQGLMSPIQAYFRK